MASSPSLIAIPDGTVYSEGLLGKLEERVADVEIMDTVSIMKRLPPSELEVGFQPNHTLKRPGMASSVWECYIRPIVVLIADIPMHRSTRAIPARSIAHV